MFHSWIIGDFLYFPKDKSAYIPAAISFFCFFIMAVITMRFIVRYSKREEMKAKELEDKLQISNQQKEQ